MAPGPSVQGKFMHRVDTTDTRVKRLARAQGQTTWREGNPALDPAGDVGRNRHHRLAPGDIARLHAPTTPVRGQLRNGVLQVDSLVRAAFARSDYPRRGIKPAAHRAALSLHLEGDARQRRDVSDQTDAGDCEPALQRPGLELANP